MKLKAEWLHAAHIRKLHAAFESAGFTLRFVGGCVRDTLLDRPFTEIDAASNATPEQMMALLEVATIRTIPTGIKHGTISALVGEHMIEITTLRHDVKTDGRHAEVQFTNDWAEDAKRRDFTINAIYADIDGKLYDPVGGLEDIKDQQLRFIGDADARIKEDYLRILRYFRFVSSVGNNNFNVVALAACTANKEGIAQLSGERIATEFLKLLAAKHSYVVAEKLLELLPAPLSFLYKHKSHLEKIEKHGTSNALLKLACLIGNEEHINSVAERLKLSNKQKQALHVWLHHTPFITSTMSILEQKKLVRKLGTEDYTTTITLAYALSSEAWDNFSALLNTASWQPPKFPITAADLMAQGYQQGKALGDAIGQLEQEWEDSDYALNKEKLLMLLR